MGISTSVSATAAAAYDPFNSGQNGDTLLGKMLRIDVSVPDGDPVGYDVPGDNPFLDNDPSPAFAEIWDFGLRNPWKFSFDDPARGGTGALFIADVGQNRWEEINWEPAGSAARATMGGAFCEGTHPVSSRPTPPPPEAFPPLTSPVYEVLARRRAKARCRAPRSSVDSSTAERI